MPLRLPSSPAIGSLRDGARECCYEELSSAAAGANLHPSQGGQARKARRDAIADYATEMAGTHLDLDTDLESAGIEHLVETGKRAG